MRELSFLLLLVVFVGVLSVQCLANEGDEPKHPLVLGLHGGVHGFFYVTEKNVGIASSQNSPIKMSVETIDYLKYEIALDLSRLFLRKSITPKTGFDINKFISEAAITIQREEDYLLALIIGKQVIPIGHDVMRSVYRPLSENMSEHEEDTHRLDGVLGITVKVEDMPVLDYLVDELEISFFESSTLDFNIDDNIGMSVSAQRSFQIIDVNADSTFSVSYLNRGFDNAPAEQRLSFGLAQDVPFPFLEILLWAEAMYLKNYLNMSKTEVELSVGMISNILNDFYVSIEFGAELSNSNVYGVGLYHKISPDLITGLEYRYTDYEDATKKDGSALSALFRISLPEEGYKMIFR